MLRYSTPAVALLMAFLAWSAPASATLIGTEFGVEVVFQQTSGSTPFVGTNLDTAIVADPGVEFPDLSANEISNSLGLLVVPVSVDAGGLFIDIDVLRGAGGFANGLFNGCNFIQ